MASKLKEITTNYHTFVENQVLTKDQLNEVVTYFDDQDRLTRVFLDGVGIVCGFKLRKTNKKIFVGPGAGVTTDGDLILLKEPVAKSELVKLATGEIGYTHYKKFADDLANYSPFRKPMGGPAKKKFTVMDLWEIFPGAEENARPLTEFPNLNDMVVLLYLESYAKEGDLCTAIDCDNQGIEQVNRLRVLLVSKADAAFIAANDPVFSDRNLVDRYLNLPSVAVKRVVLNPINTSKYEELKRAYYDAVNSDNLVVNLTTGISEIVTKFEPVLQLKISSATLSSRINTLKSILNFSAYQVPFNIQYRYDFLKDVVDTYNEIRAMLLHLYEACFPDITAFPKHLMLGRIDEINTELKHLRHKFYKSPAASCGCDQLFHCRNLVMRLFNLIEQFRTKDGEIRITPSNMLPELGNRAIPFYYDVSNGFLKSWDYAKTKKYQEKTNLCYHTTRLSPDPHIQDPLGYNIDRFDFFRIEGHQGKDYRDVLEKLDALKTKYGLAFDVKALSVNINRENFDIDDYECEFEDLKVLLKAWTAEQDCILAQVAAFFSSFSTAVPGANVKESELDLKKKLLYRAEKDPAERAIATPKAVETIGVKAVYEPVYKVSNVVLDNLSSTADTLGVDIKKAIEENKGGSVNDIIASATEKLADKVNTDEWNADPEMKAFVVEKSVELMAHAHVLTQRMPVDIAVVDTTRVTDYKLSLSDLCKLVKKLKAGYQSVSLNTGLRAFIGLLINQLSTVCCSGKKLEILLEEVNKRKEQILLRLQLSKFIERHKGLEHLAGVRPGGTFILVYKNREKTAAETNVAVGKAGTGIRIPTTDDLKLRRETLSGEFLKMDTLSSGEKTLLLRKAKELANYEDYLAILRNVEAIEAIVPSSGLPDNTVVADFALPYLCCSDCASIDFIISKPPASLRLEKDRYCLGSETDPVLFEVSPADGTVKSDPATEGLKIESNKLVLVPDKFPDELIGKPIRFTVNDQVTDAVITVYKGITADFEVPAEPTLKATHTFIPAGDLDGATFFWEFGDGNTSTERNPTHTYKLPVNEENEVTVTLTATAANGICKAVVSHPIRFVEVKPSITLEKEAFCEKDKNEYPFNVTPENAKVEIKGDGVIPNNAGGYSFVPAAAGTGNKTFTVNGEPSELTVTVFAAPVARFTPKQEGNQLILTNESSNAGRFEWLVNGATYTSTNTDPLKIELTPNGPAEWKLRLTAFGAEVCPPSRTAEVAFTTKYVDEPQPDNCIEETRAALVTDLKILHGIKPVSGAVKEIWVQTAGIYGGTAEYKTGVLDKVEAFLNGSVNNRLEEVFVKLFMQTFEAIMATDRRRDPEAFTQLVQLLELQLRLFYNVLACQGNDTVKEFADIINVILGHIIEILYTLKQQEIIFSDRMKKFMAAYALKVSDNVVLRPHLDVIKTEKLI